MKEGIALGLGYRVVGGAWDAAGRLFGHPGGKASPAHAGAQILEDLRRLPEPETASLRRRFSEALRRNDGPRFVALLSRIPQAPEGGRAASLKYLNDLSDEEFDQMVQLLDCPRSTPDRLAETLDSLKDELRRLRGKGAS
jgi:hypothetical protein